MSNYLLHALFWVKVRGLGVIGKKRIDRKLKTAWIPDSRMNFFSSGRALYALPECVRDDELMDITERLSVGHCQSQRRSGDPDARALPAHIWQWHAHFEVGNKITHMQIHLSEKYKTSVIVIYNLFSLWNVPVTYVNDSCSLAPECRQLFNLNNKSGKTQC